MNSAIYSGIVGHKRFSPKVHQFQYRIFLLALDLDELPKLTQFRPWFAVDRFAFLSFRHQDYLQSSHQVTKQAVWEKVSALGGNNFAGQVVFLGQMRCLGFYFSPINFYYCHNQAGELCYLLAEVSNTPWNERHYYLVDAQLLQTTIPKDFHVSPFMDLSMQYQWVMSALDKELKLSITNTAQNDRLFSAWLVMERQALTRRNLWRQIIRIPAMTLKTVLGIYWQALRLYLKKVPYVPYRKQSQESR